SHASRSGSSGASRMIRVRGLRKSYGGQAVLAGGDPEAPAGAVVAPVRPPRRGEAPVLPPLHPPPRLAARNRPGGGVPAPGRGAGGRRAREAALGRRHGVSGAASLSAPVAARQRDARAARREEDAARRSRATRARVARARRARRARAVAARGAVRRAKTASG